MTGEDLYREVECRRCGKTKLRNATFCPHCGHVQEEHWWDRLLDRLRGGDSSGGGRPTRVALVSTLIGVAIASFFLYNAIHKQSLQSLILAILTFVFAVRSWFATRGKAEDASEIDPSPSHADQLTDEVYCDNCGSKVDSDAEQCPKCGMNFE